MKQQIFIIHGGNVSNSYAEFLRYLKAKTVSLEYLKSISWKATLQKSLGSKFEVYTPEFPNRQNAKYSEWKIYFEKLIPLMTNNVILIGHSLGGIFLAKYLAEKTFPKKIRATMLVAAPFNSPKPLADFILPKSLNKLAKQGGQIYLYQSQDDLVVPYSNVASYQKALPKATTRIFKSRGHFNARTFSELTRDIKAL